MHAHMLAYLAAEPPHPTRGEATALRRDPSALARRAEAGQCDGDEATDRGLRTLAAGSSEGVHAVARGLVRRHIAADVARLRGRCQQVSDYLVDLPLGSPEPLVSMEQLHESCFLVPARVTRQEGIG